MTFAINRKLMNNGTGDQSGSWTFEEFMFADSVFGRATVLYDPVMVKETGEFVFLCRRVDDLVVFDDDGNEVSISPDLRHELEQVVLEAFENDIECVETFEAGEL